MARFGAQCVAARDPVGGRRLHSAGRGRRRPGGRDNGQHGQAEGTKQGEGEKVGRHAAPGDRTSAVHEQTPVVELGRASRNLQRAAS